MQWCSPNVAPFANGNPQAVANWLNRQGKNVIWPLECDRHGVHPAYITFQAFYCSFIDLECASPFQTFWALSQMDM